MEILKKLLLFFLIFYVSNTCFSQDFSKLQNAFRNSYSNETNAKYQEAIRNLTDVYQQGNYEINLRLGWLYYLAKDFTKSIKYYETALKLKPNSIEAKFGYIKPASSLEMWSKVQKQYEDILKIDKQNSSANYWLGMIFYNKSNYDLANKHFQKVVDMYPFDADANLMLAWCKLKTGNKEDAKKYFQRTLLINPDNSSATDGLKYAN